MHVLPKLILSTWKMAEGMKQNLHLWKETYILSYYVFTRRELSLI